MYYAGVVAFFCFTVLYCVLNEMFFRRLCQLMLSYTSKVKKKQTELLGVTERGKRSCCFCHVVAGFVFFCSFCLVETRNFQLLPSLIYAAAGQTAARKTSRLLLYCSRVAQRELLEVTVMLHVEPVIDGYTYIFLNLSVLSCQEIFSATWLLFLGNYLFSVVIRTLIWFFFVLPEDM